MKKLVFITIVILMVSVLIYSNIVTFEKKPGTGIYDVQGNIYIYNSLLNIWELAPPGQHLQITVKSSTGFPDKQESIYTTTAGYYGVDFDWIPDPEEKDNYDSVEIVFRGSYYYGEFEQTAHVEIWWIQGH